MNIRSTVLMMLGVLTLSGCALTRVDVFQVQPKVIRLDAVGNAFASKQDVYKATVYRAAELAKEMKYPYFVVGNQGEVNAWFSSGGMYVQMNSVSFSILLLLDNSQEDPNIFDVNFILSHNDGKGLWR